MTPGLEPSARLASSVADTAGFALLREDLARDVRQAIETALAGGAVFVGGGDPLSIFRATLAGAIRDIESHPRGRMVQEFLLKGPFGDAGPIPEELRAAHLTDDETAAVIKFIFGHMVNSFQGALA